MTSPGDVPSSEPANAAGDASNGNLPEVIRTLL